MSVEMVDVHKKNHTQNVTHLTMRIKKKKKSRFESDKKRQRD